MKRLILRILLITVLNISTLNILVGFNEREVSTECLGHPYISNVNFTQRIDGTGIVDVFYSVCDPDGNDLTIMMLVSGDGGRSWNIDCTQMSGDIGYPIKSGTHKHIVWNFGMEHPDTYNNQIVVQIKAYCLDEKLDEVVYDIDGNSYETIQIGTQFWMKENLKVTKYRDGTPIQRENSDIEWDSLEIGAYAILNNNSSNEKDTYGYLYNWFVTQRDVCPEGWHVPTDSEFMDLEIALGISESEANKLGHRGTNHGSQLAGKADLWNNGSLKNNGEFGASGFSALPGSCFGSNLNCSGECYPAGVAAYLWSSTESVKLDSQAWDRNIYSSFSIIDRDMHRKRCGFSIRCVSAGTDSANMGFANSTKGTLNSILQTGH